MVAFSLAFIMAEEEVAAILLPVYASKMLNSKKKRGKRPVWVKPYLAQRYREYRCYLKMDTDRFMVSRTF